jgi:hypothetical protein
MGVLGEFTMHSNAFGKVEMMNAGRTNMLL